MFEKGFLEDEPILLDMVFRWVEITSLQHYLQEQRKGGSKTPNLAGPKILPFCNTLGHSVLSLYIYTHIYIYIPGTQMTPVLIGKSLVLGGWPSKIGVIWVLGIYIYIHMYIYIWNFPMFFFHTIFSWRQIYGSLPHRFLETQTTYLEKPLPESAAFVSNNLQTVEMLGNTGLPTGPSQGDQGCFRFSDGISRGFRPDTAAEIQRRKKHGGPSEWVCCCSSQRGPTIKKPMELYFCGLLNIFLGWVEKLQPYPRNIMQYYAGIYFIGWWFLRCLQQALDFAAWRIQFDRCLNLPPLLVHGKPIIEFKCIHTQQKGI